MRGGYDGADALVLGMGVSGEAAALLLLERGGRVAVADEAAAGGRRDECAARLRAAGARVAGPGVLPEGAFDVCVASPAFAPGHPWLAACRGRGIPLISELELGGRYWPGRILAVTGSKGKSSLVKLCADTLARAGRTASPAGNYGIPLCRLARERPAPEWAVVEVSSFQMELTETFRPDAAVLLNVQADHLDRHGGMAAYRALKLKMFRGLAPGGAALLPEGLDAAGALPEGAAAARFGDGPAADWRYEGHGVSGPAGACGGAGPAWRADLRGSWFDNGIFGLSAAAGCGALAAAGLSAREIEAGFAAFEPLPHRMQFLGTSAAGVRFVDDSKATSLTALAAALKMAPGPVRLIAGGLLKENDCLAVKELLTAAAEKVYLIGRCSGVLSRAWGDAVPCEICGTMERAVARAAGDAREGETVLLSPGTASFDQFSGYRERGERFSALAREVAGI